MVIYKKYFFLFLCILFLIIIFLAKYKEDNMPPEKALNNFSKIVKKEGINDLTLTIYYMGLYTATNVPMDVNALINQGFPAQKIIIKGNKLEEYTDIFRQVNSNILRPVEKQSRMDIRIYYVFRTKYGKKIFDFAIGGWDTKSMYVNRHEYQRNDIFCEIIMPFLPEDYAEKLKEWIDRGR